MREILFRGKHIVNGRWVYGYFIHIPNWRGKDKYCIQTIEQNGEPGLVHSVDPATVGQYTGLKDEDGQKIFDGDILQYKPRNIDYWRDHNKWYCVVMFGDFNCSCCDGVYGWYLKGGDIRDFCSDDLSGPYLVVGNIYDTPEFMEEA